MYTFRFIVGNSIPKSITCIHSATKNTYRGPYYGSLPLSWELSPLGIGLSEGIRLPRSDPTSGPRRPWEFVFGVQGLGCTAFEGL